MGYFLILEHDAFYTKVLRILEGDMLMDSGYMSTPGYDPGNRSGRYNVPVLHEPLEGLGSKHQHDALRAALEREREGKLGSYRR